MRITEIGNRVKCVRQNYDADVGRGVSRQVLSFPRFTKRIEDIREEKAIEQLKGLTPEELKQLADWLDKEAADMRQLTRRVALTGLVATLDSAIEGLADEACRQVLTPESAEEIWLKIREMQQALKASGFKRPKFSEGGE